MTQKQPARRFLARFLTLTLILDLSVTPSAFALRQLNAGMEESPVNKQLRERFNIGPASRSFTTGLEESVEKTLRDIQRAVKQAPEIPEEKEILSSIDGILLFLQGQELSNQELIFLNHRPEISISREKLSGSLEKRAWAEVLLGLESLNNRLRTSLPLHQTQLVLDNKTFSVYTFSDMAPQAGEFSLLQEALAWLRQTQPAAYQTIAENVRAIGVDRKHLWAVGEFDPNLPDWVHIVWSDLEKKTDRIDKMLHLIQIIFHEASHLVFERDILSKSSFLRDADYKFPQRRWTPRPVLLSSKASYYFHEVHALLSEFSLVLDLITGEAIDTNRRNLPRADVLSRLDGVDELLYFLESLVGTGELTPDGEALVKKQREWYQKVLERAGGKLGSTWAMREEEPGFFLSPPLGDFLSSSSEITINLDLLPLQQNSIIRKIFLHPAVARGKLSKVAQINDIPVLELPADARASRQFLREQNFHNFDDAMPLGFQSGFGQTEAEKKPSRDIGLVILPTTAEAASYVSTLSKSAILAFPPEAIETLDAFDYRDLVALTDAARTEGGVLAAGKIIREDRQSQEKSGMEEGVERWLQELPIWSKLPESNQLSDLQSGGKMIAEVRGVPSLVRLTTISQGRGFPSAEVSHGRQILAQSDLLPGQTLKSLVQRFGTVESLPRSLGPEAVAGLVSRLTDLKIQGPKAMLLVEPEMAEQIKAALAEVDPEWKVPVLIVGIPKGLLDTTNPDTVLAYLLNLLAQVDPIPGRHIERLEATLTLEAKHQTLFLSTGA